MKRIVVLGSGFAGMQAVVELEHLFHNAPDYEILLVSDQNFVLFTPLLPQIASSHIDPRHIAQAVRDVRGRRRFRFLRSSVRALDLPNRRVETAAGPVAYDSLVIALGSRTNFFNTPGAREHTFDFKTLEDSVVLREHILDLCEHADHVSAAERRRLLTIAVVGGGYTGVELLTDLQDFLFNYAARRYRGISRDSFRLLLVEATGYILAGIHPTLRAHAMRRLSREGIEILYNSRVTRCFENGVEINAAGKIPAATVVWTAGVRVHELVEALPGAHDRTGRACVNEFLQLENYPEVLVAGDSAVASSGSGVMENAPQVAPVAISHGKIAARNIAHRERNERLESYHYVSQGMLVSLGARDAVVSIAGFQVHGYFAWLFWNAVHLYKLVSLKKQFQVALDWSLASIFPRDTAIIRRPRACKLCESAAAPAPTAASAAESQP